MSRASDAHLIEVDATTVLPTNEIAPCQSAYIGIDVAPNGHIMADGTATGGDLRMVDTSGPPPVTSNQKRGVHNNVLAFSSDSPTRYPGGGE